MADLPHFIVRDWTPQDGMLVFWAAAQRLKPPHLYRHLSARLKTCPDTTLGEQKSKAPVVCRGLILPVGTPSIKNNHSKLSAII